MSTGSIHHYHDHRKANRSFPSELQEHILTLTDWKTCIKFEAIRAGLPQKYEDAAAAIDRVDLKSNFPITIQKLKT
ncbi:hypothetical protein HDU97_002249 [Phlyctochytrium planicorne]|nr:hypothetical protein HDU97_002249 [Phlyctochytrium planicorne]